jgi:ABC-type uncharacterized transport system substrate-binding protein
MPTDRVHADPWCAPVGHWHGRRGRSCLVQVVLALGLLLAPLAADAQGPAKVRKLGILTFAVPRSEPFLQAFLEELRRLGYAEGQNLAIEYRSAEGKSEQLPGLAADLVRLKVDVIVTTATAAALAAKHATGTIPIVFTSIADPVRSGLALSLARPGGNITGLSLMHPELSAKRLELLKEAFPKVSRVAVLTNPADPISGPMLREVEGAAAVLRLELHVLEARDPKTLDGAFAAMKRDRAGGLLVLPSQMFLDQRRRLVDLAARGQLPAMYYAKEFTEAGGLMAYGPNLADLYRRAATYVDKILKGAKPADLPVEQPTRFELAINLKTAKALGLTLPQSILVRADQVIR